MASSLGLMTLFHEYVVFLKLLLERTLDHLCADNSCVWGVAFWGLVEGVAECVIVYCDWVRLSSKSCVVVCDA